jgi:hypothetical protein
MKVRRDNSDPTRMTDAFCLAGLIAVIGYRLTAYIGSTSAQSLMDWLRDGLPADIEPRLRAAFEVAKPIADVESVLPAQGFLVQHREETGSYGTPARMLREADVETARSILMLVAAAEFLSNEAADLEDVAARLQEWISGAVLPERVAYRGELWQGLRLSLTLLHSNFPDEVQRIWDSGIDWPCWDQILVAAPEMACARPDIDLMTGCPFRYLRSQLSRTPKEIQARKTAQ